MTAAGPPAVATPQEATEPAARLRILHVPYLVGGNPGALARSERSLGVASWSVAFSSHPFGYPCDEILWDDSVPRLAREYRRWRLFRRALSDFDVLHFNSGQSILSWGALFGGRARLTAFERIGLAVSPYLDCLDLPAYRRAGKVIAVTYQGDEARQADYCLEHFEVSIARAVPSGYYSPWSDTRKRQRIAKFARFADLIYAVNPDLLRVLPPRARFVPYAHVDPREWPCVLPSADSGRPLIVVHAPSHRGVKGTPHVLAAIDRVRSEGLAVELRLVEGVPHAEAKRVYAQADIVVDQLLAGWYGGLAVEAMALGKPVVAYIRESDLGCIAPAMRAELPIVNADPATIYHVLKRLLTSERSELVALGKRSRAFVERWHDPIAIAAGLVSDYERVWIARSKT